MLSEGISDGREVPSSSASYPSQNYGATFSPTEASPVPWSQGQQTLLTKNHLYTDFSSKESNDRRQPSQRPNYSVNVGDKLLQNSPLLLQLLTNNNKNDAFLLSQQSKTTPRPTPETPFSHTVPKTIPKNKHLDDDQILKLIEEKLTYFRALMKAQKSGSSSNSSNTAQQPTSGTSAPRAPDDHISKDHREAKTSSSSMRSPDQSRVKNNGTAEYVRIMQESSAVIAKEAEDSRVVLQAPGSFTTVQEHRPALTVHHKPSNQIYNSTWRNVDPTLSLDKEGELLSGRIKMKAVEGLRTVVDSSKVSQGSSTSTAFETIEREICLTKNSREKLPQISSDSEHVTMLLSQNSSSKTDFANISSGSSGQMKECKRQFMEGIQQGKVKTGENKMERGLFDRMHERLSLPNKNIYENLPVQSNRHLAIPTPAEKVDINSSTSQFRQVSMQLENVSDDEGPILGNRVIQAEISGLPKQNSFLKGNSKMEDPEACTSNWRLQCACPVFVETEDGFERRPCPKCALDNSSRNWKDEQPLPKRKEDTLPNPEDFSQTVDTGTEDCLDTDLASDSQDKTDTDFEEDEWFVVPLTISDLKLEQEIIVLDDTDEEEEEEEESEHPLSLEPQNQPIQSCFQKLPEYDSLSCFLKLNQVQFNYTVIPSVELPLAPSSVPTPGAVDKAASEPTSATPIEAEDSCDTDDSSDYPLQTTRNHLTASRSMMMPSSLLHASDNEEEGEVAPPGPMSPGSPASVFNSVPPVLSTDEEEEESNTANDPAIASTVRKMLCNDASKSKKRCKSKTFNKRRIIMSSDDDDEDDHDRNLKRTRSNDSEIPKASSQPKQTAPRLGFIQARLEQNDRVLNKGSSQGKVAKRKSSAKKSSSSPEAAEITVQVMSEEIRPVLKISRLKESSAADILNRKAITQNATPKASNTKQNSVKRQLSQPSHSRGISRENMASVPTKTKELCPPCFKQSHPEPQSFSPPKPNRVNSYSTDKSTPAKKRVVEEWKSQDFPPLSKPRTRRRSNEQGPSLVARQKRNPHRTPLMKKTLSDAVQLTQQIHRQAPTEQNPDNRFIAKGYKWKQVTSTNDLDWERERNGCSPQLPKGLREY